ncbi:MAG: AI-2E family transporter [Clostridia bacterium]
MKQILFAYLPNAKAARTLEIGRLSNRIFSAFVSGQLTEAVIIGVLCFFGMTIFRMPYAPMVAVLVGFTALIPIFGAFIGTAIGAFLILMVSPIKAFWFVIFIIVLAASGRKFNLSPCRGDVGGAAGNLGFSGHHHRRRGFPA